MKKNSVTKFFCEIIFCILIVLFLTFSISYFLYKDKNIIEKDYKIETLERNVILTKENSYSNLPELEIETLEQPVFITRYYYTINDLAKNGKIYQGYLDEELQDYLYDLCVEYEIEEYYKILLCQFYHESHYLSIISESGDDYGIAQINIKNHDRLKKALGVTDFLDPKQSLLCGVYMMKECLEANNYEIEPALVRYNTGNNNSKSTNYSRTILSLVEEVTEEIRLVPIEQGE